MAKERLASKAKACYLANGLPDHSPLANMNPKLDLDSQCRTSPDKYRLRGAVVLCLHAKIDEFVQFETNQRKSARDFGNNGQAHQAGENQPVRKLGQYWQRAQIVFEVILCAYFWVCISHRFSTHSGQGEGWWSLILQPRFVHDSAWKQV